jgi:hypothetical protein
MKKLSLIILSLLFIQLTLFSQPPDTLWTRAFGLNLTDAGTCGIETDDGCFIFTGVANSTDIGLLKTDANGNLLWLKTFGGVSADIGYSVIQSSDGGYVIAGVTYSYGAGSGDGWLIKVDSAGNQQWSKTFGGTETDFAMSVKQTTVGGYIIAGYTKSYGAGLFDVWLIKVDPNGDPIWEKTFGGTGDDFGYSVDLTSDGGYVVVGSQSSFTLGGYDIGFLKVDDNGNLVWLKNFGGTLSDQGYSVKAASDGGYIIAGSTSSFGAGGSDVWLIKTNSAGTEQWIKTYGGADDDDGRSVDETSDGCYVITGDTRSFGAGSYDVGFLKVDSVGNLVWITTFGGLLADHGRSVMCTSDGGFIITGGTNSFSVGGEDVWAIKTKPDVTSVAHNMVAANYDLQQNFPNPFNPSTKIRYSVPQISQVEIKVFNVLGDEVEILVNEEKPAGTYQVNWNAVNLPSGVYFYQIKVGTYTATKKMVLLK